MRSKFLSPSVFVSPPLRGTFHAKCAVAIMPCHYTTFHVSNSNSSTGIAIKPETKESSARCHRFYFTPYENIAITNLLSCIISGNKSGGSFGPVPLSAFAMCY